MSVEELSLMKLLRGERSKKVPFWEVWFAMYDFCERYYGDYAHIENRIAMVKDLGMDAIRLDVSTSIDTNVHFVPRASTSNEYVWYGGRCHPHAYRTGLFDCSRLRKGCQ